MAKRSRKDELEELERAFQNMSGKRRKKKKNNTHAALWVAILAAVICCGLAACALFGGETPDPTQPEEIFGNVTAAGVNLSGCTKEEAAAALNRVAESYASQPMNLLVGDQTIAISPTDSGAKLDVAALVEAAYAWGQSNSGEMDILPYLGLNTAAIDAAVTSLSAQFPAEATPPTYMLAGTRPSLAMEDAQQPCQTLVVITGTSGYTLETQELTQRILGCYNRGVFRVEVGCTPVAPEQTDLQAIYEEIYIAAVDASIDYKTYVVTPSSYGYDFDFPAAQALLEQTGEGQTLEIPLRRIEPEITSEELNGEAYFRDVLASYKTPHTSEADRNTNLKLACKAINGYILEPGETFSYNSVLGKRTEEKGYKGAGAYSGGLTVTTIGGGICQVSSTLYYCTLVADLKTVTRLPHSYVPSYMPAGTDATVSWGGPEFKFMNNTNYPIRIEAEVSGGYVHVKLIGTDEKNYRIELATETVSTESYETVYEEYAPDNKEGYKDGQVLVTPYSGAVVKTYKKFYDKETGKLIDTVLVGTSTYKTRNKVVCKIVSETEPTEPTEPEETQDPSRPTIPDGFFDGSTGEDNGGSL